MGGPCGLLNVLWRHRMWYLRHF